MKTRDLAHRYPRALIWVAGVSTATLVLQILEMKG